MLSTWYIHFENWVRIAPSEWGKKKRMTMRGNRDEISECGSEFFIIDLQYTLGKQYDVGYFWKIFFSSPLWVLLKTPRSSMTLSPRYKGSLHESQVLEHLPLHHLHPFSRLKNLWLSKSYASTGPVPPLLICNLCSEDSKIPYPSGPESPSMVCKKLFPGSLLPRALF